MGATDLQIPDPPAQRAEAAIGFLPVITCQVTRGAEREVDVRAEVLAGLAVVADHLVGDERRQERSKVVLEGPVVGGEVDAREVHPPHPFPYGVGVYVP
jgi:hypothetical protein